MDITDSHYYAFMLRLWKSAPDGGWRGSLEDPYNGDAIGFPDLASLVRYLSQLIDQINTQE